MFPKVILAVLLAAACLAYYRRHRDLPLTVLFLLASLFFSRIYWRVEGSSLRLESFACLALALNLIYDLFKKKVKFKLDAAGALVLGLLPVMILPSVLVSPSPLLSLKKTIIYIPYLMAFAALRFYLDDERKLARAWNLFFVAGSLSLALSFIGCCLFWAGIDLGMIRLQSGTLWLRGTMAVPNILGSTAALILVTALVRLTSRPEGTRTMVWSALPIVPAAACVMMSMTRSAWVCGGLVSAALLGYALGKRRWKAALVGSALLCGTIALIYLATTRIPRHIVPVPEGRTMGEYGEPDLDYVPKQKPETSFNYSARIAPGPSNKNTFTRRLQTAKLAVEDWRLSPVIGRGTEALSIAHQFKPGFYIPSTWIAFLHDWGILGLGLHLAFLLLVGLGLLRTCARSGSPRTRELTLNLLLVLALSTLLNQVSTTMQLSIFWVLLAFFASASSLSSRTTIDKKARVPAGDGAA